MGILSFVFSQYTRSVKDFETLVYARWLANTIVMYKRYRDQEMVIAYKGYRIVIVQQLVSDWVDLFVRIYRAQEARAYNQFLLTSYSLVT